MSRAYLTTDDGPTKQTPKLMDYLTEHGITPIFFFTGTQIELNHDEAIDAIKRGAIVGNHSYSHPNFDKISLEEGIVEITKTEVILNKLYKEAGVEREYKLFRFPYGAQGGENKQKLQEFLCFLGFDRIDDREVTSPYYIRGGHKEAIDVYWTFDFEEYRMHKKDGFGLHDILAKIHDKRKGEQYGLLDADTLHIVLIHDHMETEELLPGYYTLLLNYVMKNGVTFVQPEYIRHRDYECK